MDKKILSIVMAISLLVFSAVPVFALSSRTAPKRYIPTQPRFISGDMHGDWDIPLLGKSYLNEVSYISNLGGSGPYFVFIVQGTHTDYYPIGVSNPIKVGEDKKWSVVIMKPHLSIDTDINFSVYDPLKFPDNSAHPISIDAISTTADMSIFNYDYASNSFSSPIRQTYNLNSPFHFTYVLFNGGNTSLHASKYPFVSSIDEHKVKTAPREVGDTVDYYSWWCGIKSNHEENTSSEPTSSEPTSSGGTSSKPTSSEPTSSGGSTSSKPTSSEPTSSGGGNTDNNPDFGNGGSLKPGVGGDGSDTVGGDTNGDGVTFTIKYFSVDRNGVKTPIKANYPYDYKKITTAKNTVYTYHPPTVVGYVPEYGLYKWLVTANRVVEVLYYPYGSGSGGSSGGGSTGGGGGGGNSGDTHIFFPIKPFDPWSEVFESATKDPWNGFDIMGGLSDGIFQPKPLKQPDTITIPPKEDIKLPTIPNKDNPFKVTIPNIDNPFNTVIPNVDNPFYITIPNVDNPFQIK